MVSKYLTMQNFMVFSILAIFSSNLFFAVTLKNVINTLHMRRDNLPSLQLFKTDLDQSVEYLTDVKYALKSMNEQWGELEKEVVVENNYLLRAGNILEERMKNMTGDPRRLAIREATRFAWDNYVKYAWGKDELNPISKVGKSWMGLGLTIIDSIDTLWIMGLKHEYKMARKFIEDLNLEVDFSASVFEMNIRILGGLLSCYSLTDDEMFLVKAKNFGDILMHAFAGLSSFPSPSLNLKTKALGPNGYFPGNYILSEVGSLQMEFCTLSYLTKDPKYCKATLNILVNLEKKSGSQYKSLYYQGNELPHDKVTIGGLADSFYEYLLKMWVMTDKKVSRFRTMYDAAAKYLKETIVEKVDDDTYYFSQVHDSGAKEHKMEHLACFGGGMFGLGAVTSNDLNGEDMKIGRGVTKICFDMYNTTRSGIGPEDTRIINGKIQVGAPFYYLRPEAVESIFYYWRFTHEEKYRDWGWQMFLALNTTCRVDSGFVGLHDVNNLHSKVDKQESFFIAETLKYLYLLFSDDSLISLDEWVLNTEAHPLPIWKGSEDFMYLFKDFEK